MLIQRQYKILKLLVHEDRWFTTNELAQKLNCSIKTIQRDLVYLQKKLPDKWFIKNNKKREFRLYKPFDSPIENINYLYFRNTFLFKALDIIMNINVKSNSALAENLYIQSKKVKVILKEVERYLNKYNLRLKRRPLRISGNNLDIILMYHEIYLKTYGDEEWPFEEINRGLSIELLTEVEKSKDIKYYKQAIKEISFFIALYLKRKCRGYSITVKHRQIKKIQKSKEYIQQKDLIQKIFQKYNIQLSIVDIAILLTIINRSEYTYKKPNYIESLHSITKPVCPFVIQLIEFLEKNTK